MSAFIFTDTEQTGVKGAIETPPVEVAIGDQAPLETPPEQGLVHAIQDYTRVTAAVECLKTLDLQKTNKHVLSLYGLHFDATQKRQLAVESDAPIYIKKQKAVESGQGFIKSFFERIMKMIRAIGNWLADLFSFGKEKKEKTAAKTTEVLKEVKNKNTEFKVFDKNDLSNIPRNEIFIDKADRNFYAVFNLNQYANWFATPDMKGVIAAVKQQIEYQKKTLDVFSKFVDVVGKYQPTNEEEANEFVTGEAKKMLKALSYAQTQNLYEIGFKTNNGWAFVDFNENDFSASNVGWAGSKTTDVPEAFLASIEDIELYMKLNNEELGYYQKYVALINKFRKDCEANAKLAASKHEDPKDLKLYMDTFTKIQDFMRVACYPVRLISRNYDNAIKPFYLTKK